MIVMASWCVRISLLMQKRDKETRLLLCFEDRHGAALRNIIHIMSQLDIISYLRSSTTQSMHHV